MKLETKKKEKEFEKVSQKGWFQKRLIGIVLISKIEKAWNYKLSNVLKWEVPRWIK